MAAAQAVPWPTAAMRRNCARCAHARASARRAHPPEHVRRRGGQAHRTPATSAAAATPPLLDWLVRCHDATPACLKVERRFVDEDLGFNLVATADIEPEEVILSVPLTAAITSQGVDESRWSTHMALQLLARQQHAAEAATSDDAAARVRSAQSWLDALPAHVDLPWLYWSAAELEQLQDEDTVAEAGQLRAAYEAACQEVGGECSAQQVAWALSMVFSRSFVTEGAHTWVPGIDLCNHSLEPSADIRLVRSPGSCQGAGAVEDVCPPATAAAAAAEPSRFELVAGEHGVAAGEEVSISYGGWPSDVFLLFFGFAPHSNPHDSAVLFYDLFELSSFKLRWVDGEEQAREEAVAAVVQHLEQQLGPQEQFCRMVATAAGIDGRLLDAAQALLMAGRGSASGQPMSLPAFLQQRCQQLLDGYATSLEEDEALSQQLQAAAGASAGGSGVALPPGVRLPQLATAVRYRLGKKRVLRAVLDNVMQQ